MIYECSSYAYRGWDIKSGKRHSKKKKTTIQNPPGTFSDCYNSECVKKNCEIRFCNFAGNPLGSCVIGL